MGADLILAVAPVERDFGEALKRIDTMTEVELNEVAELRYGFPLEDDADGMTTEDVREEIRLAFRAIADDDWRRDVVTLTFGDDSYYVTGGMSWGDSPTEAFGMIELIAASRITDDTYHDDLGGN